MKRSEQLKQDKAILVQNINNYIEKNEAIKSKLKSVNDNDLNSEDTLLMNSIYDQNQNIIASIDKTTSNVQAAASAALAAIDNAINEALEQERQEELAKAKEDTETDE